MKVAALGFGSSYSLAVLIGTTGQALAATLKIVRVPIILSALGPANLGFWTTCLILSGLAMSYEYVLTSAITKDIARASEFNKTERIARSFLVKSQINKIYRKYCSIFSFVLLLVLVGLLGTTNIPTGIGSAIFAIVSVALASGIYLLGTKYIAIMDGVGDVWVGKLTRLVYEVCGFIFIVVGLRFASDLHVLFAALLAQSIGFLFLNYLWYKTLYKRTKIDVPSALTLKFEPERSIVGVSLIQSSSLVYILAPAFFIPVFFDYEVMAAFSIVAQLCQLGPYILLPIISAYLPKLVNEVKANDVSLYARLAFIVLSLIFPLYIILFVYFDNIILFWLGSDLYFDYTLVVIVILISFFEILYLVLRQVLVCTEGLFRQINIAKFSVILFFALASFVAWFNYSFGQSILSVFVPSLTTIVIVMNIYVGKVLGNVVIANGFVSYVVALFSFILVLLLCAVLQAPESSLTTKSLIASALIVYVGVINIALVGKQGILDLIKSFHVDFGGRQITTRK